MTDKRELLECLTVVLRHVNVTVDNADAILRACRARDSLAAELVAPVSEFEMLWRVDRALNADLTDRAFCGAPDDETAAILQHPVVAL
jgi:hypothetical protein